ncbi:MAG: 2-hydroxyacyl-CoA dehydratase [Thermoanaerobaculia bacterium]|nr:2-hydroxyacyl-CoA dehydratase [Thermoanaerobaculia bacterium]
MTRSSGVFEEWQGCSLEDILGICRDTVEEGDYSAVQRWREGGGRVVGHFQVYFPSELVHAAGMLPVKVCGAPVETRHADSRFGSYLCSILGTSLELALNGTLELDMFVSHPICDAARNLAAIWSRNFDYPCQILYLPQNANSKGSADYLRGEYARLLAELEEIAGRRVETADLARSIDLFNESRALVRRIYEVRRETPWKINAEDSYSLVAIGGFLPVEEHLDLLRTVVPMIEQNERKPEDRIRVVFEGAFCEQPPLDLIRMLGRTCYVVDDDFLIGLRWITEDVETEGDALGNLARAYLEQSSYSPVQHDNRKPKEKMLLDRVRRSKADAVILTAAKMCEPGLEEQVAYVSALDDEMIPYFISEFEQNMSSFGGLELQLETFSENLLFD